MTTTMLNEIKASQVKAIAAVEIYKTKNEDMYNKIIERMNGAIEDMENIDSKIMEILNLTTPQLFLEAYYTMLNRKYAADNKIDKSIWGALVKML